MSVRLFSSATIYRCLICACLGAVAAFQSGCAFFPGLSSDRDVQTAVEKAADDPFPSAKQAGLSANEEN